MRIQNIISCGNVCNLFTYTVLVLFTYTVLVVALKLILTLFTLLNSRGFIKNRWLDKWFFFKSFFSFLTLIKDAQKAKRLFHHKKNLLSFNLANCVFFNSNHLHVCIFYLKMFLNFFFLVYQSCNYKFH